MTDEDVLLAVTAPARRRRLRRVFVIVATVIAAILVCVMGTAFALLDGLFGDDGSTYNALGCGNGQPVDPKGPMPQIGELVQDQVRIAATVVKTGQDMNVPPRGWVIAVATALQESRLQNLPDLGPANDHDSIGVFQQRPSQGWGTVQQLSDPAYQARKFYAKLLSVPGWETMPLTQAAQAVQVSAFPDAYAKQEPLATKVVDALTGGAGRAAGYDAALQCAAGYEIAASGWTVPVIGPIVSGFRTPDRPAHDGVDLAVPKGTPIHAAAAGVVLTVLCNATFNGQAFSCDQDGSMAVLGCGWYVDILHAGRVITRYCHQMQRPFVHVGDYVGAGAVIGVSGSSGNSSGPHVHFEVHLNGDPSRAGAVDPVVFMNQVGAPLGVRGSA